MVESNPNSNNSDSVVTEILNSTKDMPVKERMVRSKYGMLEILRATYNRVDAVMTMRRLNRRFLALSKDAYLDTFDFAQDTMYFEVRKKDDLEYFQKMVKYANLIKGENCLHIEFFWNFAKHDHEEQEAEELVDILLQAQAYKKLTIGSDGIASRYLPKIFLDVLVRELGLRQTKCAEICLDLEYYGATTINHMRHQELNYPDST